MIPLETITGHALGELEELLAGGERERASGAIRPQTMVGRLLAFFGTPRDVGVRCHMPLVIVEPSNARLFAKILITLLGGLAVVVIVFARQIQNPPPDLTIRLGETFFKGALQIFSLLVVAFWIVDVPRRRHARRAIDNPIEKDV